MVQNLSFTRLIIQQYFGKNHRKIQFMKVTFLFPILLLMMNCSSAQIKFIADSTPSDKIEWNNYSTTYLNPKNENTPIIITAIPYNGFYTNFDEANAAMDMSFEGSLYSFKSNLNETTKYLYTYDSAEVYFLTPFINSGNSNQYEFRVVLNAKQVLSSWHTVDKFIDIALGSFPKGLGNLGGYKASWGNFILVELRNKATGKILSRAIVSWKEANPVLTAIYTSENINEFLKTLKRPWDRSIKTSKFPEKIILQKGEDAIVFYLKGEIYKKEALEYSLVKNGDTIIKWKANEYDNNFVWLKNLAHGNYTLRVRYARQRHNVSDFYFEIEPLWYETNSFYFIAGISTTILLTLFITVFYFRRKIKKEVRRKEKLNFELKAIRSQLNPHFIFNALNSIQGLINKNEIGNANKYLSEFAGLMRDTLESGNQEFNNLSSEIKTLENYLRLEQLRFAFQFNISVDQSINASVTEIPTFLLQPLVENAVKHGVASLHDKGKIEILFTEKEKDMVVVISDNGNGFKIKNENGYGLKLTKGRIELLNTMIKGQSISLSINTDHTTVVYLTFKNWL